MPNWYQHGDLGGLYLPVSKRLAHPPSLPAVLLERAVRVPVEAVVPDAEKGLADLHEGREAERGMGEVLRETPKQTGGRPSRKPVTRRDRFLRLPRSRTST